MKNIVKKILASVLCAVILVASLPLSAFASGESAPDKLELSDDYISITVSGENGGFLIKTVNGDSLDKADDNKDLLYPSADYDTSYTSIRVTRTDGSVEDYIFGRKYGFLGLDSSDVTLTKNANAIEAVWSVNDITVTQTLGILDEAAAQHGMVSIDYTVTTTSDDIDNVKMRIMLDTALGEVDYGYYQIPNVVNEYQSLTYEYMLDNTSSYTAYNGAFFALDDPLSTKVTAYTVDVAVDGKMVKPYQVAFAHWNSLASTVFDFVPDETINFTNAYNRKYMTADSAYALYYDMGEVTPDSVGHISTYYGVYSNSTVSSDESVAINFSALPASMVMTEDQSAYVPQIEDGREGDVKLQLLVENLAPETVQSMTLVVKSMKNVIPYVDWIFNERYEEDENFTETRYDFVSGKEEAYDIYFNVTPLPVSEYRKFEILCYDTSETDVLMESNLLGSREFYLFCPGVLGEIVTFNTISPTIIHHEGTRRLFISGQNIRLLQDTTAYATILRSTTGGAEYTVPSWNVVVDTSNSSMYITVDTEMLPGSYQVVFDWYESGKEDTTDVALQFMVSDKPEYIAPTYGIVTVEKDKGFTNDDPKYRVGMYESEEDYKNSVSDPNNTVYLEFRGNFGAKYDENGNLSELKAASESDPQGNILNTINISNCLDIEDGFVSISVENYGTDEQCINIDIDGRVYTTNARSTVWNGVCAISPFENGELSTLVQYNHDGTEAGNIDSVTASTNSIMLMWPGAASGAQTLAGMIFELRYCYFGMMATKTGTVTSSTPKIRVVSFGAQLDPSFLLPRNFDWGTRETSAMEVAQMKMSKENYTADDLRNLEERLGRDQKKWREAQKGNLNLYVDNIIFGGGFIGFVSSVELGLPSYAEGMPGISGTLDLKIMPAMRYWEVGVSGEADFEMIKFEAALTLKQAHGGIPSLDKLYLYIEGDTPGINVDGMGIFWIQGIGGGIDNLYDTVCMVSKVPPITFLLSGKFALFSVLSARADLALSMRGFEIDISDLGIKDITLIDNLGLEVRWYPALFFRGDIKVSILGIIEGGGYIVLEESLEDGSIFWEAFARVGLKIPHSVPLVGGYEIGSASLGINTNKMWGAMSVIGIDFGVTYYWGGDVDFAIGKYDAPAPTYPLRSTIPVGVNEKTGQTLYMSIGTNATLRAQTFETTTNGDHSITSNVDRMYHTVDLGGYKSTRDMLLTMSYYASTEAEAEAIAKGNIYGNSGIKIVAADDESVSYELKWLDSEQNADEQEDANAILSYDEETGTASVAISFTDESAYAHDWNITTNASAELALYEMKRMAGVDSASYEQTGEQITLDIAGNKLGNIDTLAVYAMAEDGSSYALYQTTDASVICGGDVDATSNSVTFDIPTSLPSGEYSLRVVASSVENNVNNIIDISDTFTYTNEDQPAEPTLSGIALGGDYSIDADISAGNNTAGYIVTVYEKQTVNGETVLVASSLGSQVIEANEDGTLPETVTVGGQYISTSYVDADGNMISGIEAEGRDDVTAVTSNMGLEAGKTYVVGVSAYNESADGSQRVSAEVFSSEIVMVAPSKPEVSVSAQGAVTLADDTAMTEGIDYVRTSEVTFDIISDVAVSGEWSLDGGEQAGTFTANTSAAVTISELSDGDHTLTLTGTNAKGDGFAVDYRFHVKATAPRLQIASPDSGSFFGKTVTVTGLSELGAQVVVLLDGQKISSETVGESGSFEIAVDMDTDMFEQTISVYAEDSVGNKSHQYDFRLINSIVAANDVTVSIFVDGKDYTNRAIPAGTSGKLSLKVTSGGKSLDVPVNSVLGSQAEWSVEVMEGTAAISSDMTLTTDGAVNGMLKVSFEDYDVATVLGGNNIDSQTHRVITLPEVQENYTITAMTDTAVIYGGSFLFKVEIAEGYSATESFAVKANGVTLTPNADGVYFITNIFENQTVIVEGIADITAPAVSILIGESEWNTFADNVEFDTYFDDTQSVSITATDSGSGLAGVYYHISASALTLDGVSTMADSDWSLYENAFEIAPELSCIVYVKTVDNDGNIGYYSTGGIVLSADVPCTEHKGGVASCTQKGVCEVCGEEYLDMLEHDTELVGAVEPTADSEGYTGDIVCKNCKTTVSKGESIPALTEAPTGSQPEPQDDGGLPTGAIVGIVIGAVVVVGIGGFAIFWFVIKKKKFSDLFHK